MQPITRDIVGYKVRAGWGRENPICPQKGWTGRADRMRDEVGGARFLVEGGNHCPQALGIHACRLRESPVAAHTPLPCPPPPVPPPARARVCVRMWECEFTGGEYRRRYIIRLGSVGM